MVRRRMVPKIPKRKPFEPRTGPTTKTLDMACRAHVFTRDGHRCRRCGTDQHLQWAHIYSRRYHSLRWDPLNSLCLCAGCHLWGHHRPTDFADFVRHSIGESGVDILRNRMRSTHKIDRKLILISLQRMPRPIR